MKHLRTAGVVIGLAAYTAAFYATPLPKRLQRRRPTAVAIRSALAIAVAAR